MGKDRITISSADLIDCIKSTYGNDDGLDHIQKNVKDSNVQTIRRKINDLKNFRKKSDYQDVAIGKTDGEKGYKWSLEIQKKVKEFLS